MKELQYSNSFLRDYKRIKKRNWNLAKLEAFVALLAHDKELPHSARPHKLSGEYTGMWDAHIAPDWILIYEIEDDVIKLRRTGTHSDLFR